MKVNTVSTHHFPPFFEQILNLIRIKRFMLEGNRVLQLWLQVILIGEGLVSWAVGQGQEQMKVK